MKGEGVIILLGLLVITNTYSERVSSKNGLSLIAAVVEYSPTGNVFADTVKDIYSNNIHGYETFIEEACAQGAEIIVFPEYGLTTGSAADYRELLLTFAQDMPEPVRQSTRAGCNYGSCRSGYYKSWVLSSLSFIARKHKIFLVVNLPEKVTCATEDCPDDGVYIYNTDIVFDPCGSLVAKYHKFNAYLEPIDRPVVPEASSFVTSSGVKIGLMTCFDLVYEVPYILLDVDAVVLPTDWVDELPFLTAVQAQSGWSWGTNKVLLAANYHDPSSGAVGSGIYAGRSGALNYTYRPEYEGSTMLVSTINFDTSNTDSSAEDIFTLPADYQSSSHYYLQEDLSAFNTALIDPDEQSVSLCHNALCCNLTYNLQASNSSNYRFITYNGVRSVAGGLYYFPVQVCGMIACTGKDLDSCTSPPSLRNEQDILTEWKLEGNFTFSAMMLMAFHENYRLIPLSEFTVNKKSRYDFIYQTNTTVRDPFAIGIYARDFNIKMDYPSN